MTYDEWINSYYKTQNYDCIMLDRLDNSTLTQIGQLATNSKYNGYTKLLVEIPNTYGVSLELLSKIPANLKKRINIRVRGFMDEKWTSWAVRFFKDPNEVYRWINSSIFTVDELKSILIKFEKIEKGIKPEMNDEEKAIYLAETLSNYVEYDKKSLERAYNHDQVASLRAFDSTYYDSKAVCAGMSVIYKELLDRQKIESDCIIGALYQENTGNRLGGHMWNLVNLPSRSNPLVKKKRPIDVTSLVSTRFNGDNTKHSSYYSIQDDPRLKSLRNTHKPFKEYPIEYPDDMEQFDTITINNTISKYCSKYREFRNATQIMRVKSNTGKTSNIEVVRLGVEYFEYNGAERKVYMYYISDFKHTSIVYSCKDVIGAYRRYDVLNDASKIRDLTDKEQKEYKNLISYIDNLTDNIFVSTNFNKKQNEGTYFLDDELKKGDEIELENIRKKYATSRFNRNKLDVNLGNGASRPCILELKQPIKKDGTEYHQYVVYYMDGDDRIYQQTIFTEYDLNKLSASTNSKEKELLHRLLNPNELNGKVRDNGGFLVAGETEYTTAPTM